MYVITGITGQVGGALANALLNAGKPVRAVVRDEKKRAVWAARGCEIALATMTDADALAHAFEGAEAVFILPPPEFDPAPGFPEAREVIDTIVAAVARSKPRRIVCLSTIGAQATQTNLLTQRSLLEEALRKQAIPVTFLRPGWFMENCAWDVDSARNEGIVRSFLQPLDRAIPMIATDDIGELAAKLMQERWSGVRIVELEGPRRTSSDDIAAAFAQVLGKPVRAQAVPRDTWEALFVSQGMKHPTPRIQMLDGFNEGWIDFEGQREHIVKGTTPLVDVIRKLVAR
ncbi:NmrA family NAD(P)-binding protein [Caballeronia novacaledonica]|uniref:NmrA family NAD(P)-binding protein n=1 Tax=Caballeronia novacaledonica TaxID=1544861 RepID=UPI001EE317A4|nr:NmrA family NAD(P)-binding protein [Caballeronia novacaledonica]GJH09687.1 NmrA family NAD(P)-binding protein [Caballeronia novacaledonica]